MQPLRCGTTSLPPGSCTPFVRPLPIAAGAVVFVTERQEPPRSSERQMCTEQFCAALPPLLLLLLFEVCGDGSEPVGCVRATKNKPFQPLVCKSPGDVPLLLEMVMLQRLMCCSQ